MATREEIKKTLRAGGEDMNNPQQRTDAALLAIMEKQDAGSGATKSATKK